MRWSAPALVPVAAGSCRSSAMDWFAPDDARERARLDSWCRGVGEPEYENSSAITVTPAMSDIVFVSWNVHVGSGDIRSFVDDLRAGQHTGGRRFPHFVLLLQEVVRTDNVPPFTPTALGAMRIGSRDRSKLIDVVRTSSDLGTSLIYVPSMRNGRAEDSAEDRGSAILSTLPLSAPTAIELPGEHQRRVAITAEVATITVAVVHLDALGGAKRLRVFWTPWMRDRQIRSAMTILPNGPLVIGADLNTWHGRDELAARFLGSVFRDTPISVQRQGLGLRVLDYMFFRAPANTRARYREIAGRYGSDHRPLVGWIEPVTGNP